MIEPEALLLLSHLKVQNANAISSPMVWGFPSPTAFLGFAHALHRELQPELGLALDGVGIICHRFEAQASQPAGKRTHTFHLTRNPIGADEKAASIVEEGRVHLDVSLLIGASGDALSLPAEDVQEKVMEIASKLRLAGGSLIPDERSKTFMRAELHQWPGTDEAEERLMRRLKRRLLPGFALVSRETLLEERHREMLAVDPLASMLDAFLDLSRLNIDPPTEAEPNAKGEWGVRRKSGWIVPLATGFQAISDLYPPGAVKNARDRTTPFRFVEGIYTTGEWKSPHRIQDLRQILWTYAADPEQGLYRCTTPHFSTISSQAEGQ